LLLPGAIIKDRNLKDRNLLLPGAIIAIKDRNLLLPGAIKR
jgi:hypothetical protein